MKNIIVSKYYVRKAFLAISGIKVTSSFEDIKRVECITANCRDFCIRLLKGQGAYESKWILQLAVKKAFDRWANSVNFVHEVPLVLHYPYSIDFNKSIAQARKVVRAKAFNWNSYFSPIYLDAGWSYDK